MTFKELFNIYIYNVVALEKLKCNNTSPETFSSAEIYESAMKKKKKVIFLSL